MKKIICIVLALSISISAFLLPATAASPSPSDDVVTPYYSHTSSVSVDLNISDGGLATIGPQCVAYSGTTSITATTYIELQINPQSWVRIDNGQENDQWVDTVSARFLSKTYEYQLSAPGTYRAVTIFAVTRGTTERIAITSNAVSYYPY